MFAKHHIHGRVFVWRTVWLSGLAYEGGEGGSVFSCADAKERVRATRGSYLCKCLYANCIKSDSLVQCFLRVNIYPCDWNVRRAGECALRCPWL